MRSSLLAIDPQRGVFDVEGGIVEGVDN